jgi:hypothetical protein
MKYLLSAVGLALLTLLIAGIASFGAIHQGVIPPPTGTFRMGPVTLMALPPCPTIPHGSLVPWGRRCGAASAWALWLIVRHPDGDKQQWQLAQMNVDR